MTKWPQNFWLAKSIVVLVLIFVSNLGFGCSPTPTPASFYYSVRVQAGNTSEPIPEAEVKIEVRGKAPLDAITDSIGCARIFIDSSYAGQPGKLIVDATNYMRYEKNIDLTEGTLPHLAQLQKKSGTVSPSPTSIMPLSDTVTPPPTQSYPAPILVSPASGATIVGEELINFSWQWDRDLQKGEKFDLRIWQPEKPCSTVALPYEHSFLLNTPPDGFGHYLWQVAVVRIDESGSKSLSESEVWPFVWNSVLPTPTSTMTPTPTPEPDAVVKANALNLRSGPGVVYDVLRVLKQGDSLKVMGRNLEGDWLKVIYPDGKEGWVAASLLEINLPLPSVAVVQIPPTPTPMYTPTPIVTPTPTLLPPPILLEPENGAAFLGEPVLLKWGWDRPRAPDEVFFVRVRREGETRLCHCDKAKDLQYQASLSYCTAGTHYWSVVLVRDLRPWLSEEDINRWQDFSVPSEERWFYYVPSEEPWTWPTPDKDEGGGTGELPLP